MRSARRVAPGAAADGSPASSADTPASRDIAYHAARSLEEPDRAAAAADDAWLAHEQLAARHLQTAIRLRRGELRRIVADASADRRLRVAADS